MVYQKFLLDQDNWKIVSVASLVEFKEKGTAEGISKI
jgi:hypothetical protein